jgi:hypothetical protein
VKTTEEMAAIAWEHHKKDYAKTAVRKHSFDAGWTAALAWSDEVLRALETLGTEQERQRAAEEETTRRVRAVEADAERRIQNVIKQMTPAKPTRCEARYQDRPTMRCMREAGHDDAHRTKTGGFWL